MRYWRRCSPTSDPPPALRLHRVRPLSPRPREERTVPAAPKPGEQSAFAQPEMTSSLRLAECGCPPIRRQASAGLASCGSTAASPPRTRTLPVSSTRARHLFAAAHRPFDDPIKMRSVCEPFVRLPPVFDERQTPAITVRGSRQRMACHDPGGPKKTFRFRRGAAGRPDRSQKLCFDSNPLHERPVPSTWASSGVTLRACAAVGQRWCHFTHPLGLERPGLERPGWSAAGGCVVRTSESGRSRALSAGC